MALTAREQQIVALLRQEPTLTAAAIAEHLGSTRAAVNVHLSNLGKKGVIRGRGYVLAEQDHVVVVGGANLDVKARSNAAFVPATSNPGRASIAPGGVGRNIAENLARLGTPTHLVSAVGRDPEGQDLLDRTRAAGVHIDHVRRSDLGTGSYVALLDDAGELIGSVSDMAAVDGLGVDDLEPARTLIARAGLLVVDGNLAPETLAHALEIALSAGVRTVLEPVSAPKAARLADRAPGPALFAVTPNRDELAALTDLPTRTDRQLEAAVRALHAKSVEVVWVRLGADGSLLSHAGQVTEVPAVATSVEDVTGAGDAMLAAFVHALLGGATPLEAARFGHGAAALTIASPHTVRPDITVRLIESVAPVPAKEHRQ